MIPPRTPTDTDRSYQAFCDYCAMGVGRSLEKLAGEYLRQSLTAGSPKPPSIYVETLKQWSVRDSWQVRVKHYDDETRKERDETDKAIWAERRRSINERDYEVAEKLRKINDSMIEQLSQVPMITKRRFIKGKDGEPDREIIQVAPNFKQAAQLIKLVHDLQRAAAGMRTGIDVTTDGKAIGPTIYLPAPDEGATPEVDGDDEDQL